MRTEIDTSTTAGKIAVMQAFERTGMVEQSPHYPNVKWETTKDPTWNWTYFQFRIADPYAELKAAVAAGKVIQTKTEDGKWVTTHNQTFAWCLPLDSYRIKPEPQRVPLTAEDIPAVCWLTAKPLNNTSFLVTYVSIDKVGLGSARQLTWTELQEEGWEYSEDHKNWKGCYKEI
jgi:hypothetical protein